MCEDWVSEVKAHMLNRLPLRLVDGHSKGKPHWKLLSFQVEPNHIFRELELDPGDEGLLPMVVSTKQMHLQDMSLATGEDGPGATAQSIGDLGIEVPGGMPDHSNACSGLCNHPA